MGSWSVFGNETRRSGDICVKQRHGIVNAIWLVILEIRIGVHANEVASCDHDSSGVVRPEIPCVSVPNPDPLSATDTHHSTHIVYLLSQGVRVGIATVQILGTNGDGGDP